MYYNDGKGGGDKEPHWFKLVLVIVLAAYQELFWPMAMLFGAIFGVVLFLYLFTMHSLAALGFLALVITAVWLVHLWKESEEPPRF